MLLTFKHYCPVRNWGFYELWQTQECELILLILSEFPDRLRCSVPRSNVNKRNQRTQGEMHQKEELICAEGELSLCLGEVGVLFLRKCSLGYKPPQTCECCQKSHAWDMGQVECHPSRSGNWSHWVLWDQFSSRYHVAATEAMMTETLVLLEADQTRHLGLSLTFGRLALWPTEPSIWRTIQGLKRKLLDFL